jgi:hypothetical protein
MRTALVSVGAVAVLVVSAAGGSATGVQVDPKLEPEGCQAVNPVAPTCSFTVLEDMDGPVAGAAGYGTWIVKIKRGKQKMKLKSPASGEPTASEFLFEQGDKVSVTAVSAGSGVIAGGD